VVQTAPSSPIDGFQAGAPSTPAVLASEKYAPVSLELAIRESIAIRGTGAELPTPDEIATLEAQGKHVVFSNLALNETYALGNKSEAFATREHVQGVVLSIDSYETKDLDNAMSFRREADGSMVVGVHAVDLAEWVRPGGALDFAARRRVDTRYLENQGLVLPMLPLSLSEGKLSLFENEPRLTRSVEMRFSPSGQLLGSRIFRSQLVNRFRLDSADAATAATGAQRGATNPELQDALSTMASLAAKASGATDQNASMSMEKMLGYFTQTSSKLVGEALANADLEASFRNQEAPNTRSSYGSEALGHASIGAQAYAQWTGPMRRYADLDVHRAMDRLIDDRKPSGRAFELDSRLRDAQLDRANKVVSDPQMDFLKDVVKATRVDD
jgi:exoribonuclease R